MAPQPVGGNQLRGVRRDQEAGIRAAPLPVTTGYSRLVRVGYRLRRSAGGAAATDVRAIRAVEEPRRRHDAHLSGHWTSEAPGYDKKRGVEWLA